MSLWIVIVALAWTVGSTAMLLVAVAANMRLEAVASDSNNSNTWGSDQEKRGRA